MPRRSVIGPWLAQQAILEDLKVKHPVIFDVGAHFGNVTEFYLRMFEDCTVVDFEPEPVALNRLRQRFENESRVTIEPTAIAHRRYVTKRPFYVGGQQGEMSSLIQRPTEGRRHYRHELEEGDPVKVDSIDEYCDEHAIERVHILKLDIQGAELHALKGASNLLVAGTLPLIYTEVLFVPLYDPNKAGLFLDIANYLKGFGYELFDIYGLLRSKVNRRLVVANVLFVSPQVVEEVLNSYPEEWLRKSREEALGEPSL